jgi:hypothetical protein
MIFLGPARQVAEITKWRGMEPDIGFESLGTYWQGSSIDSLFSPAKEIAFIL